MSKTAEISKDEGIAMALLDRFQNFRMPRALDLKKRVDAGETLDDVDIEFLEEVLQDANQILAMAAKTPEYQQISAKALGLYHEIVQKALQNEKARS
jgi:hypothetical protein